MKQGIHCTTQYTHFLHCMYSMGGPAYHALQRPPRLLLQPTETH
jgi:hypothetical protein